MPKISTERRQYYKSKIRSVIVQSPQISQVALAERLKGDGLELDRKYLGSLLNDIHVERVKRLNTLTLNYALSAFQDVMTEIVSKAWEIVNDPMSERGEVLAALREIRAAHDDVFEKLFDAGVFERKLGTLDATIRNTPLPDEKKKAVAAVFTNWGLFKPTTDKRSRLQVVAPYIKNRTVLFSRASCELSIRGLVKELMSGFTSARKDGRADESPGARC
jgi:hypothetical protein